MKQLLMALICFPLLTEARSPAIEPVMQISYEEELSPGSPKNSLELSYDQFKARKSDSGQDVSKPRSALSAIGLESTTLKNAATPIYIIALSLILPSFVWALYHHFLRGNQTSLPANSHETGNGPISLSLERQKRFRKKKAKGKNTGDGQAA